MARARYQLDAAEVEKLEAMLERLTEGGEDLINNIVHKQGPEILASDITRFINTSKTRSRPGQHATQTKWQKVTEFNLGFELVTKGGAAKNRNSYGYLVFPDEGRGRRNPIAQNFTGKGSDEATPKIMELLNTELAKKIREELII